MSNRPENKKSTGNNNIVPDYRVLFESTPGLYLVLLPDLTIAAVNDAYLLATMTKREEIIGKGLFEVFPDNPDDITADGVSNLRASLNYVLNNKKTHTMAVQKYDIKNLDGNFEERYWSPINKPVLNEKNEVDFIIHRVEDVTEYVKLSKQQIEKDQQAEQLKSKLADAEIEVFKRTSEIQKINSELEEKVKERTTELQNRFKEITDYKLALDAASIVAITNHKGIIQFANDNFCKISKYSKEELIGQDHRIVNSGYHDKKFIKTIWQTIAKGKVWKGEIKNKAKDGSHYWVDTTIIPFLDEQDKPYQYVAIRSDITERKKIEEELQKNEEQFRNLLENMLEGAQIIDYNWKYIYVNNTLAKHGRYSKEELLGYTVMEKYPGIEQTDIYKAMEVCMNQRVIKQLENEFVYPDGSHAWFELSMQPVPEGIFMLSIDITERKKAEAELHQLNNELEMKVAERTLQLELANKELESFSYSVSHDLRAPLRAINGFSKILKEDFGSTLDIDAVRYLNRIIHSAGKMGQLIDDLLTFSRMSRKELAKRPVDMHKLATVICLELKNEYQKPTIELNISELPVANADLNTIKQVWINLISNAFKYSRNREKQLIELGSYSNNNEVVYYVKDNGAGFNMQYADKLFGVFNRLHAEDEFEGTGVGLAIVHRIITKHDGSVWAEAEEGKGATFYFSLPKYNL